MTAPALAAGTREWDVSSTVFRAFVAILLISAARPACAEVGAAVSAFSDARFRGYSLSSGHPVGVADLSYDDPSGLYGAVSGSVVATSDDSIEPLGLQLSGGYAKRLPRGFTVDVGAVHSRYSRYSSRSETKSYTEIYAGLSRGAVTSRIYFSPHYFGHGSRTLYGELDATISPMRRLRVNGHAGLLVPIDYRTANSDGRTQYDWRLGMAREIGRGTIHVIASGGGPGSDYYSGRAHGKTALTVGLSWAL